MQLTNIVLFGHRRIENQSQVEWVLERVLSQMLDKFEYVDFYVGRNGDFDILSASTLKRIYKKQGCSNSTLNLVLPYPTAEFVNNQDSFLSYYNDVDIMFDKRIHHKSAIGLRNKNMVDTADIVVCYVINDFGGAYEAMKYAKKQGVPILNIADYFDVGDLILDFDEILDI